MKTGFGITKVWISLSLFLGVIHSATFAGQTSVGILPVSISADVQQYLNNAQCQELSTDLMDYLIAEFSEFISITKLSREHILLLIKELPGIDPASLGPEAYKVISSKEKLHYLVYCSTGGLRVQGNLVIAPLKIMIIDGINGKVFWEKEVSTPGYLSGSLLNEGFLFASVYKPSVNELLKEIETLKF